MVPPFYLCVCRFFLSGPPLVSGGSSFLPRTLISGRQTQAYCFVCFYCNRIGTKYTKEKIILPNSFLPYPCRILSLKCNLAGLFPSNVTLPKSLHPNYLVKCIASVCRLLHFMLDLLIPAVEAALSRIFSLALAADRRLTPQMQDLTIPLSGS